MATRHIPTTALERLEATAHELAGTGEQPPALAREGMLVDLH